MNLVLINDGELLKSLHDVKFTTIVVTLLHKKLDILLEKYLK